MLSQKEKQEMLADSRSIVRRETFRKIRPSDEISPMSLDSYLRFLGSVIKTFGKFSHSTKKPAGKNFKL